MKKYKVTVIQNTFFCDGLDTIRLKNNAVILAKAFLMNKYNSKNFEEFATIEPILTNLPFSNLGTQCMVQKYKKDKENYHHQILLFNSISDVTPKIKKAVKFLRELHEIGFEIYILSLNPIEEYFKYRYDFLAYNKIDDEKKYRSEKYDAEVYDFAVGLRQGNPVKYRVITEYTGIPKGTLISYMEREKIGYETCTGRDYLTQKEINTVNELRAKGLLL